MLAVVTLLSRITAERKILTGPEGIIDGAPDAENEWLIDSGGGKEGPTNHVQLSVDKFECGDAKITVYGGSNKSASMIFYAVTTTTGSVVSSSSQVLVIYSGTSACRDFSASYRRSPCSRNCCEETGSCLCSDDDYDCGKVTCPINCEENGKGACDDRLGCVCEEGYFGTDCGVEMKNNAIGKNCMYNCAGIKLR